MFEIVEKFKKEGKLIKLDIACGNRKEQDFIGIDVIQLPGVDIVYDLEKYPYPFEDNSVDEITCKHYVEHVKDLIKFMDEIYRILKPGAKCNIVAPYYSSIRAWQDPTHVRAISEATFLYFNKQWREINKLEQYGIKSDFDFTYGYAISPEWQNKHEEARNFAIKYYINVVLDIYINLTKKQI